MAAAIVAALAAAVLVSPPASGAVTGFRDVGPNHKFHDQIMWMVEAKITGGYTAENRFKPLDNVSREAFAAFLYRLAGRPSVSLPSRSPFPDVGKNDAFYREIVWLSQQEITTGWADGTFRPKSNISREAMAAFLYRYEGRPEYSPPETSPFHDVPTDAQFYKEITWLRSEGMAHGWADGTFRPNEGTTREATAAFLFRKYAPEDYTVPSVIYRPGTVLSVAKGEVGYREPSWRNNKYNDWIGGNNAWCHVWVAWVFDKAGFKAMVPKHDYFPTWANILKNSGVLTYNPKRSDLRPGMVVLFDWSGNGVPEHTGIVDRATPNGAYFYEGNTGSNHNRGVMYRWRDNRYILAVFDPLDYYKATR